LQEKKIYKLATNKTNKEPSIIQVQGSRFKVSKTTILNVPSFIFEL